ncbi:hypothetical protein HPB51_024319 [Rhipicephalus microplus]|uniref:Fatty acyl-CoA reductase n=1 Tax=Rhipicephalus microplus TaxID=6941 RepID=A0A9J6DY03_RHIMP|nr:hypothetical protein HPB51_024319 [Rhipicephalus microplus]
MQKHDSTDHLTQRKIVATLAAHAQAHGSVHNLVQAAPMNGAKSKRGGHSPIEHFFRDKAVFITGGTGFLGKILIEKLLRSCSGVKAVYVLLRAKDGIQPNDRLQEMFQCPALSS